MESAVVEAPVRYDLRLAALPVASATLETLDEERGRRTLSLRAGLAPALRLFTDTTLALDVLVEEDRRPVRAVAEEVAGDERRRTLLAFDDDTGSVVVKESDGDRSRVRLLQADAPWEPLSLAEAVAHLPFDAAPRTFDVLLFGRMHRLTVRAADGVGARHLAGTLARPDGDDDAAIPIEAWFDGDGRLARATVGTPLGALELARAGG